MSSDHPPLVRTRLSIMMFLEFFLWAAWYVPIGGYMNDTLGFSGKQIGWIACGKLGENGRLEIRRCNLCSLHLDVRIRCLEFSQACLVPFANLTFPPHPAGMLEGVAFWFLSRWSFFCRWGFFFCRWGFFFCRWCGLRGCGGWYHTPGDE